MIHPITLRKMNVLPDIMLKLTSCHAGQTSYDQLWQAGQKEGRISFNLIKRKTPKKKQDPKQEIHNTPNQQTRKQTRRVAQITTFR
jgi:hypothetical protein